MLGSNRGGYSQSGPSVIQPLLIQPLALLFEDQHGVELVGTDFFKRDPDSQLQCSSEIESAADEQSGFAGLCRIELVERAVVAAAAVLRRIGT